MKVKVNGAWVEVPLLGKDASGKVVAIRFKYNGKWLPTTESMEGEGDDEE